MTERMSGSTPSRVAVRAIRLAIFGVFVEGVRSRNPGAAVNAVLTLVGSYLPGVVERSYGVEFQPWQRVYAAVAMLAHAVGMLGPYDDTWWWDHLTHTLSATLLGGVAHVTARRRGSDPLPHVLTATASLGALWELLEYAIHASSRRLGVEPILVHYSRRDSTLDLVFDFVGAIVVYVFGDRFLRNFIRRDP